MPSSIHNDFSGEHDGSGTLSLEENNHNDPLVRLAELVASEGVDALLVQDEDVLCQMRDFFKECSDERVIREFAKLFKGSSFFDPLVQEIQDRLFRLTKLLEIERLSIVAGQQTSEGIIAKNRLKNLLGHGETIIIESAVEIISRDFPRFTIRNNVWSMDVCCSEMLDIDLSLKKFFDNEISNILLLDTYQQYLLELIHSSYLKKDKETYQERLISGSYFCRTLLMQGYDLSPVLIDALIKSCKDNEIDIDFYIHHLSIIISQLLSKNKLPSSCEGIAIELLQGWLGARNSPTLINIAFSFYQLALLNIVDDGFTVALCDKHLCDGEEGGKESILSGLENIVLHAKKLPEGVITIVGNFIQDISQQRALRIRAIKILHSVVDSVSPEIIGCLSQLLVGEERMQEAGTSPNLLLLPESDGSEQLLANPPSGKFIAFDYRGAQDIVKLLEEYVSLRGDCPSITIRNLEQALGQEELSLSCLKVLGIIASKNPYLLSLELIEYIKEHDLRAEQQIAYDTTVLNLQKLLADDASSHENLIKQEIGKLASYLSNSDAQEYGSKLEITIEIMGIVLAKHPSLFKECLQVIKLITTVKVNIAVIEQLLSFGEINYQDLCYFVKYNCKSSKLYSLVEQYFNDNIGLVVANSNILSSLLCSLNLIAFNAELQIATLDNLLAICKIHPSQSVNIGKILCLSSRYLSHKHFEALEEMFARDDIQLFLELWKLFSKANKQVTTQAGIDVVFKNLMQQPPLKILPSIELREEAQVLLKLKTTSKDGDKLRFLSNLKKEELQSETIKTILELARNTILTKEVIRIIANLSRKPELDEEISEIIYVFQSEMPSEFKQLQALLKIDINELEERNGYQILKGLLTQQFPNLIATNFLLEKINNTLSSLKLSKVFIQQLILGPFLAKAKTIEEFEFFLLFLQENSLEEAEIARYLRADLLLRIVDIAGSKILTSVLQDLRSQGFSSEIKEITYLVYKLKANGWQVSNITAILKKINADNINYITHSLRTVVNYQIFDSYRNKSGRTVVQIIDKADGLAMEAEVFSVVCNQFEQKLENEGRELIEKVINLNPQIASKADVYLRLLKKVLNKYITNNDSGPIHSWSQEQINDWVIKFKTSNQTKSWPQEGITEVIAVLERANYLHTAKNGKEGHFLRHSQIISLLLLLDLEPAASGRLLQIATGEGKSTISAMLAAILVLYGFKVDVVTSSPVLAKASKESASGFFALLGITCGLNTEKGAMSGEKACYSCDVVYGDALNFQSDFLSNSSNQGPKRGAREFAVTIIDEVDSMLLDGSNNFTKQATPTPLMEYLLPVLIIAWHNFHEQILPLELEGELLLSETTQLLEYLVALLPIPAHLKPYANFQCKSWAKSLIGAALRWELDRDYVINIDNDGKKIIHPVDSSTGVTQENMVWQNGLHQFLQIKHNCRVKSESLTCFFITNITYFLGYNKILGISGTLGSHGSQEFLQTVYGVELAFIPTYKDKQLIELPPRIETTSGEHMQVIVESSYQEAVVHHRAVLIICKNIKDVNELILVLKERCGSLARIINYSRSEEKLYNNEIEQITGPHTIIVATNLAGRGTDIKTSPELEMYGGLHVIVTFLAKNARDEAQIKGRTARQGNSGSYQIIALDRSCYDLDPFDFRGEEIVNNRRQISQDEEIRQVRTAISTTIPKYFAQDKLYSKFSKLYLEFVNLPGSFWVKNAKIKQLIEDFGLWLKTKSNSDDSENIEDFLSKARDKFARNKFTNPSYLITQHYGINDSYTVLDILRPALEIEGFYNFAAHYYSAKAYLEMGPKNLKNYKDKTVQSLMEAGNKLSELISYLTSMGISATWHNTSLDNELLQQISCKVAFFKEFIARIEEAIKIIQASAKKEVKVKSVITPKQLSSELSSEDIVELDFLGVHEIFEVETYEPKKHWFNNVFVGCCAIFQMALGALITIGSLGSASALGARIFYEGLKDGYNVIKASIQGEVIDLDNYLKDKGISYVFIAAETLFIKISPNTNIVPQSAKNQISHGYEIGMSAKTTAQLQKDAVIQLAKQSAVQLMQTVAVEKLADLAADKVKDNFLGGLEERVKGGCYGSAYNILGQNKILLQENCNIERDQILKEIQNFIYKITKTSKHSRIINELSSRIFQAASTGGYAIGTFLKIAHTAGNIIDPISKIQPLIDDIQMEIENIINKASLRAQQRLKISAANPESRIDNHPIQKSFSRQIASIASSSVMNFIQGKIIIPIVNSSVNYIIDQTLKDHHRQQHEILTTYCQEISRRQQIDKLPKAIESREDVHDQKSENLSSKDRDKIALMQQNPLAHHSQGEFLKLLAVKLNRPVYLFKDKKLISSHNVGKFEDAISINYDSQTGQYFDLYTKYREGYSSLYETIAGTQNIYSAEGLVGIHQEVISKPQVPAKIKPPVPPKVKGMKPTSIPTSIERNYSELFVSIDSTNKGRPPVPPKPRSILFKDQQQEAPYDASPPNYMSDITAGIHQPSILLARNNDTQPSKDASLLSVKEKQALFAAGLNPASSTTQPNLPPVPQKPKSVVFKDNSSESHRIDTLLNPAAALSEAAGQEPGSFTTAVQKPSPLVATVQDTYPAGGTATKPKPPPIAPKPTSSKGKGSVAIYNELTAAEKAQIMALSGGELDLNAIAHIARVYNKCFAEIEARKDQPVKSIRDRAQQAADYAQQILQDAGNNPYKMQIAEYQAGAEATGLALRFMMDNIQKATDQFPRTKAAFSTPFACVGEVLEPGIAQVANYVDPKGEIRQAIADMPGEGTKTLLGLAGGAALGAGAGLVADKLLAIGTGAMKGSVTVTKDLIASIDKQIVKADLSSVTSAKTVNSFMAAVDDNALILQQKHYNNVHNHVQKLVEHGAIKLTPDLNHELQLEKLTKFYQHEFTKYQNFNVREGQEWKLKIVGNPQVTGTEGHARYMTQIAIEQAKDPEVRMVFMNQGMKKASGTEFTTNTRPDIVVVKKDGKFQMFEVQSKTDEVDKLTLRMENAREELPRGMRGEEPVVKEIPGFDYSKYKRGKK